VIAVTENADGVILPVWAKPGARYDGMDEVREGALVVSVNAIPEDDKANAAIIDVLARGLNLRKAQIQLLSGATSRRKRFLVAGVTSSDLIARIDAALTPTIYDPSDPTA
jgi:hypothetical protein